MSSNSLFGRVQRSGKRFVAVPENHARTPLRYVARNCIGTLIIFESQVKTPAGLVNQANTSLCHRPARYWLPDGAAESNVSGGSKKQLCHRAESDSVPALHC